MELTVKLTGTTILLLHNERLANPRDPLTRQMKLLTDKRKKTEDDFDQIARLEFEGSLYLDANNEPGIPTWNIKRSWIEGARASRNGKDIERSVTLLSDIEPLLYSGPRTVQKMWDDGRFVDIRSVKIGTKKVSRCRPRFMPWSVDMPIDFDEEIMDIDVFEHVVGRAGLMAGLGDFRQRFGRYEIQISK